MRPRSILVPFAVLLLAASFVGAAVPEKADFLASLSAASAAVPSPPATQTPSPLFLQTSTGCTSDDQCPAGKLCCRDCGYFGCTHMSCLTPIHGECRLIP